MGVNASDGADPIPDPEIPASLISHCVRNALTLMHIRGTRRRPASQASRDASHLERYLTQRAKFIKAGCGPDPIITFCRARTQTRSRISQLGCGMMPRRTTLLQRTGALRLWRTSPCMSEMHPVVQRTLWGWTLTKRPMPMATAMRSQVRCPRQRGLAKAHGNSHAGRLLLKAHVRLLLHYVCRDVHMSADQTDPAIEVGTPPGAGSTRACLEGATCAANAKRRLVKPAFI